MGQPHINQIIITQTEDKSARALPKQTIVQHFEMRHYICLKANKMPQNKHTPFASFSFYWIEFADEYSHKIHHDHVVEGHFNDSFDIRKSEDLFYFISRCYHHHHIVAVTKFRAVLKQKKTFFYFYNTTGITSLFSNTWKNKPSDFLRRKSETFSSKFLISSLNAQCFFACNVKLPFC